MDQKNNENFLLKKDDDEKYIEKTIEKIKNIIKLSSSSLNKKFDYYKYWKLKESKLLLRELNRPRKYYEKYKRGTIIKVDFGVNIGSEFSQVHYAIVLNKNDNRMSNTLSVIPLTSKEKNNNYNIGNVIFDNFISSTKNILKRNNEKFNNMLNIKEIELLKKDLDDLEKILDFYGENPVCSFACYKNISTISKTRIVKPINKFDFINKARCSKEIMNKLDEKIIEYYTDFNKISE